jgi:hypothetical protein
VWQRLASDSASQPAERAEQLVEDADEIDHVVQRIERGAHQIAQRARRVTREIDVYGLRRDDEAEHIEVGGPELEVERLASH